MGLNKIYIMCITQLSIVVLHFFTIIAKHKLLLLGGLVRRLM